MELGDAQQPGWEKDPSLYKPRDLENMHKQSGGKPLPLAECIRIGTVLTDALNFLHSNGLTHRDIKPSNIIFVNGRPKLADIGLVTDIRPPEQINTFVGTPGYMPPPPEPPGTPHADIYAMGMVLYVISTGYAPKFFPDIGTTLMQRDDHAEFMRFDAVILRACQPDIKQRYQAASEMLRDLENLVK
jgi:eukaryotic-like serine/threonine-protein kinase